MKNKRFNRRHINPFVAPKRRTHREPHRSSRGQRAGSGSAGLVSGKYQQEKNCHFQITHFSDGDEIALGYKGGYDLILMDIEMTFMDGMSAAEEIRRADPEVLIIFITNSPQYAIKGYAVQALDYILKPLSYYAFCQRMNHVRELLGRRQKHFLTVPCAGGVQKLDASDIYYVEICDHDLLFHTKQGEVHSTGSMRDVEQKLPPENFFRSSKA